MNSKEESILLQSEFIDCQKIFTAIGDETRQYLISVMIMEKCDGFRVIDIAKRQHYHVLHMSCSFTSYADTERCRIC